MKQPGKLSILLAVMCSFLCIGPASAELISEPYPECGEGQSLEACPPDMTYEDGSWRGITWSFTSFVNPDYARNVRPEELSLGSGNWMDKASQLTLGQFAVPIAVIDSGIRWRKQQVVEKTLLNAGELEAPQDTNAQVCPLWDCNGDGIFTVADYVQDQRIDMTSGADDADDRLDPSDLIATFSDGLDGDANGYIDDIAGWDFMWNDNEPKASNDFYHGTAVMTDAVAMAGEQGSDLGYCPNCSILPVRVSDSFIGEANKIADGVLYAVDRGVKVIAIAMGGITNSRYLQKAFEYAWANGVLVVVAIGDELSYHHLPPGSNDFTMPVHSIIHYPFIGAEQARSFLGYNGCNNYGAHLALVAATNDCATGSVAIISGIAGMVYSRGLELGYELNADEVRSILINGADDINVRASRQGSSPYFPSHPGWDQFFGYGRVNAYHALQEVDNLQIPPEAHLLSPRWYDVLDPRSQEEIVIEAHVAANRSYGYDWKLEWAPGADVRDDQFRSLSAGSGVDEQTGILYRWPVASIPTQLLDPAEPIAAVSTDDPLLQKLEMVNAHAITLRLTVTDERNRQGQHRKTFFLHEDPDLIAGFPRDIGPGDSSPTLADMDGDGISEIVVANSDGMIFVMDGSGRDKAGWPVQVADRPSTDPLNGGAHLAAPSFAQGGIVPAKQGILGGVSVADLDGDGAQEVLVATLDGWLFAYDSLGQARAGFPVKRDDVYDSDTSELLQMDPGIAASPLAVDLDADGKLEIVLPAMDQKLYVWREDGSRQPGFPVVLEGPETELHNRGRIVSSAATGDLDGDGDLEIIVGSNEYDPERFWLNYVYAVHHNGTLNSRGAILPGWPAELMGPLSSLVNYMGEGITSTPVVADIDFDGDEEVAFAAPGWCPQVLDERGNIVLATVCDASGWGVSAGTAEGAGATFMGNLTFADVDQDGRPELIGGITGLNWGLSLALSRWVPYQDHMVVVWDMVTGEALDAWPRVIEDIMMFVKPEAADVSGDGHPEVLMSSGGYLVHAWSVDGEEVDGWPKFTGGWVYTAIRVGDITGDESHDVVAMTREGLLWAWSTPGQPL